MKADCPAPAGDGGRLQVGHRHGHVGHAHLQEMAQKGFPLQRDDLILTNPPDAGHEQFDQAAPDFGSNSAGQGFKGKDRRGDAGQDRKPGGAASAVAAHLGLGAVGVIKAPVEIRRGGGLDEDQAVGPGPQLAMANPAGELRLFGLGDEALPVVHQHEIVAPPVHLVEGDAVVFQNWLSF